MIYRFLICLFFFFTLKNSQAQSHNNVWFRGTLKINLNKQFSMENELQYRRQNGFENRNPFDHPLMVSYRSWFHYNLNSRIKLSFSPLAYFQSNKIILKSSDENQPPNKELRFSGVLNYHRSIGKIVVFRYKSGIELRTFPNQHKAIARFRNRIGVQYHLTQRVQLTLFDELFLNVAGISKSTIYDHNRLGIDFSFTISETLKIETGYLYISRIPQAVNEGITENNFYLSFVIEPKWHFLRKNT